MNFAHSLPDFIKVMVFILLMLIFGSLFSSLSAVLLALWYQLPIFPFVDLISAISAIKFASIILQIFSALGTFVVPAIVYAKFFEVEPISFFKLKKKPSLQTILATFVLFFLANFILTLLVTLTNLVPFESFDNDFIKQVLATEKQTEEAFKVFLNFTSPLYFIAVFIMMAILPALGEELSFRGVFFNLFKRSSQSVWIGIVLSAFIFALIHFQLHNFLAIFFMGGLLAYVYYLSESLWVSIAAHLFNNGMIVSLTYATNLGLINYDFSKTDDMPLNISIFGGVIFFVFLYFYRLWILKEKNNTI